MPHAMTDVFKVDDTLSEASAIAAPALAPVPARQHDSETPNERAMRAATAARKTDSVKRQQG